MSDRSSSRTLLHRFFRNPAILSYIGGFGELFLFHLLFTPADTPLYAFGFCASIFLAFAILLTGHIIQLIRLLRIPERKISHYLLLVYLWIIIFYSGINAVSALFLYPLL